ncbi:hypothetical protein [Intestinibacillus massiliensis]|uniref:hypothetical protein n=1 Tax=Intestinibacillus massiliensis TaxID=1871029 RepID=UPI000B353196|nr:hypothetical protein [Intestinibacillus massiliensis]
MLKHWKPLKILSCGAGTPSTTLALMACENKLAGQPVHPLVPVYDFIIFCDLHAEPSWVYRQTDFIAAACKRARIPFVVLDADLYGDFTRNFGKARVSSIPAWTIGPDGKKGKMPRQCTCDYKIKVIDRFIRRKLLGLKYRQRAKKRDIHAHEMHMGIMADEKRRAKKSKQTLYKNVYPLVEMGWTRSECFTYNKETWGLETWASSCVFCPFHTCFFFRYLWENEPESYDKARHVDHLMEVNEAVPPLTSSLYLTKKHKRLYELDPTDCRDAQTFPYQGRPIWNGF